MANPRLFQVTQPDGNLAEQPDIQLAPPRPRLVNPAFIDGFRAGFAHGRVVTERNRLLREEARKENINPSRLGN